MTNQEKQEYEQIKETIKFFGMYEYLFGVISAYKNSKNKVPTLQPVRISISNSNFLSENPELLIKAIERFISIGISIRLEDNECIIG